MTVKVLRVALVALSLTLPAVGSCAAGPWDGTWGSSGPVITVSGDNVAYSFHGSSFAVSEISMTASRLAFRAGGGSIVMTPTPDGKANFDFTSSKQHSNFVVRNHSLDRARGPHM
jgi:hypothetical protein